MWGAGGCGNTFDLSPGGAGAYVEGDLTVTPGQMLEILVGGTGSEGTGGFGGGGNGDSCGGGRSAIRFNNEDLVTAGGGGGAGNTDGCCFTAGGGATSYHNGQVQLVSYQGNNGTTSISTHGEAGGGGSTTQGGNGYESSGSKYQGASRTYFNCGANFAGAGGGGYYGGGIGCNGGGGGGSSYLASLTNYEKSQSARNANPRAVGLTSPYSAGVGYGNGAGAGVSTAYMHGRIVVKYILPTLTGSPTSSSSFSPSLYLLENASKSPSTEPSVVPSNSVCPMGYTYWGDHCYEFRLEPKTWVDARDDCIARGGWLVDIFSKEENTFLSKFGTDSKWIGLNDLQSEGQFIWASDAPVTFTNWNAGEPNDNRGEDCVEFIVTLDTLHSPANTAPSTQPPFFPIESLLEFPPPDFTPAGYDWIKDVNDRVLAFDETSTYVKYKTNISGAPYGNGTYAAWSNSIYNYLDGEPYGSDEWPPSGLFDKINGDLYSKGGWHADYNHHFYGPFSSFADVNIPVNLYLSMPQPIWVASYSFQARPGCCEAQPPTKWRFYGSNDEATWSLMHEQSNIFGWSLAEVRSFTVTESHKYRSFRWELLRNGGDSWFVHISELRVYGYLDVFAAASPTAISSDDPTPIPTSTPSEAPSDTHSRNALIMNGNFDEPLLSYGDYQYFTGCLSVPHWCVVHGLAITRHSLAWNYPVPYPYGSQCMSIQAFGSLYSELALHPNVNYSLSFASIGRDFFGSNQIHIDLYASHSNSFVSTLFKVLPKKGTWGNHQFSFSVSMEQSYRIYFIGQTNEDRSSCVQAISLTAGPNSVQIRKVSLTRGVHVIPYSGSDTYVYIPNNVTSIRVYLWGAGGAGSGGGSGAYVEGILNVTPGQQLRVIVGQGGHVQGESYGGGGIGGGGRSAIRLVGEDEDLVTAGAGGGAGSNALGGSATAHDSISGRAQVVSYRGSNDAMTTECRGGLYGGGGGNTSGGCSPMSNDTTSASWGSKYQGGSSTGFVCADGASNFHSFCYSYHSLQKTWFDARDDCRARRGWLVDLFSQSEILFVSTLTSTEIDMWIGLNDVAAEDHFVWDSGMPVTYAPWSAGQPNNWYGIDVKCAMMAIGIFSMNWRVGLCNTILPYVCKYDAHLAGGGGGYYGGGSGFSNSSGGGGGAGSSYLAMLSDFSMSDTASLEPGECAGRYSKHFDASRCGGGNGMHGLVVIELITYSGNPTRSPSMAPSFRPTGNPTAYHPQNARPTTALKPFPASAPMTISPTVASQQCTNTLPQCKAPPAMHLYPNANV